MKKVVIAVIGCLLLVGVAFFFLMPKNKRDNLDTEIQKINEFLKTDDGDFTEIREYLKNDIVSKDLHNVEIALEEYANELINIKEEYSNIVNVDGIRYSLKANVADTKKIENYKETFTNMNKTLDDLKTKLAEINADKYQGDLVDSNKEAYQNYANMIDYSVLKDNVVKYNTQLTEVLKLTDFLLTNDKNYRVEDNKVIFLKRKVYLEHETIVKEINSLIIDIYEYELVKDKTEPVITAKDVNINKDTSYSLEKNIKCVDEVDGEVKCNIKGDYDTSKVGEYKVTIMAKDEAGNESRKEITIKVKEKVVNKNPYYAEVIRNHNVVVIYGLDEDNNYTKIEKVFLASTGLSGSKTPLGTFTTSKGFRWGTLVGGVYGQYSTRIHKGILFHSVPYYKQDPSTLEWEEFNKLGSPASKGCVRLAVKDVKWIYDNCPPGMTVKIYDGDLPKGVTKPSNIIIDGSSPNRNWDPTDPDKNNPWLK